MNRNNDFDKYKIIRMSTAKSVTNVYLDSFPIKKARFSNATYADGKRVDAYVDFADLAILAEDVASGRFFTKLEAENKVTITMGGSKSSKKYNGAPESRIFEINKNSGKAGCLFVNIMSGKGKLSQTGMIMPDGAPETKIGVSMSYADFRKMIIYTNNCANAYLASLINMLVRESEAARSEASAADAVT